MLRGQRRAQDRRVSQPEEVVTTWVTAGELFYGAARSPRPGDNGDLVVRFLGTLRVLDPDADVSIAAIALSHGATVVTGNRKHFAPVPGLRIEDWLR